MSLLREMVGQWLAYFRFRRDLRRAQRIANPLDRMLELTRLSGVAHQWAERNRRM